LLLPIRRSAGPWRLRDEKALSESDFCFKKLAQIDNFYPWERKNHFPKVVYALKG
jgi:hypothetical protein